MKSPSLLLLIGALFVATVWGQTRRTTRHYRHSSAELALTNEVLIDQADCGPEETAIFVHSAATSSGTYHERRMVIRRTWAQEATANQMRVIFVLGRPRSESPTEQAKLKAEADKYNDIMQFGFEDSYYNLTLKVIGELKWAERHCNSSRYIVKADDDAILNVRMLSQLVQNSKIPSGFTGMSYHTPAYRRPGYKWYMPQRFYTQNSYQFLLGFSYILSTDKVTPLLETLAAYTEPVLDIDDVFVTGVLADRAKIKPRMLQCWSGSISSSKASKQPQIEEVAMPIPKDDPRVALVKTSFVIYEHVDLAKAEQFLLDFGLHVVQRSEGGDEIYFAGYGPDPFLYLARKSSTPGESKFCGAAYLVESRDDLEKASRIPGASEIQSMSAMPGGGEMLTLHDPSGIPVHLVHGQDQKPTEEMKLQKLVINFEDEKPRKGRFHRFKPGPAPVHKWGHYGVTYTAPVTYQIMFDWYTTHLALAPSDIVFRGEEPVTTFFHIDRDEEYTDHHAFYFKPAKPGQKPTVSHSAFEVHDIDIQQLGHDYLTSKGYKLCWGVGRHKLGSQVFDYWFDTSGFMLEHYADGDLVNKDTPVAHEQSGPTTLSMWGPPVPEEF